MLPGKKRVYFKACREDTQLLTNSSGGKLVQKYGINDDQQTLLTTTGQLEEPSASLLHCVEMLTTIIDLRETSISLESGNSVKADFMQGHKHAPYSFVSQPYSDLMTNPTSVKLISMHSSTSPPTTGYSYLEHRNNTMKQTVLKPQTIFDGKLIENLEQILQGHLAPAAIARQRHAWKCFLSFTSQYSSIISFEIPLSVPVMALFISYMRVKGYTQTTIENYSSAISYMHVVLGVNSPVTSFVIQKILASLQQCPIVTRQSITLPILHRLIITLVQTRGDTYAGRLFRSMFLFSFHARTQIEEIAMTQSTKNCHLIQLDDIFFIPNQTESCSCAFSGINLCRPNQPSIVISSSEDERFCPLGAMLKYLELRGPEPGPLFCINRIEPVNKKHYVSVFKACMHICGLDPNLYTGCFSAIKSEHKPTGGF